MEELLDMLSDFLESFFTKYGFILIVLVVACVLKLVLGRQREKIPKKLMSGDYGYHPERDAPLKILSVNPIGSYFMYAMGIVFIVGGVFLFSIAARDEDFKDAGAGMYVVIGLLVLCTAAFFFCGLWLSRTRVFYNGEQIFIQKGNGSFDVFSWRETALVERIQGGMFLKDSEGKIRVRAGEKMIGYDDFLQQVKQFEKNRKPMGM